MKIYKYILFFAFVFSSCTHRFGDVNALTKVERDDLQNLMNYLLFDHHAAFVLFGSKPMAEAIIYPSKSVEEEKKIFNELPENVKAQVRIIEYPYNPYKCWQTWKKLQHRFDFQDFLIVERSLKVDPSGIDVFVINIRSTIDVLQSHYDYFRTLYGRDFDPSKEIYRIKDNESAFWNCLLVDHIAKGILFGYGEKNARLFAKALEQSKDIERFELSTSVEIDPCKASKHYFTIPKFRSIRDDTIIAIYEREHKMIEAMYRDKDVLDLTLKRLRQDLQMNKNFKGVHSGDCSSGR